MKTAVKDCVCVLGLKRPGAEQQQQSPEDLAASIFMNVWTS